MADVGEQAPDFQLDGVAEGGGGAQVRLSKLRGHPVVLYFYPKDDTPGCTAQACDLRDEWAAFRERDAVVLGVSPDDLASHRAFADRYGLPFTLLSDPEHEVAEAYGVWKEKTLYGRRFWGIERSTFVIGRDGRIQAVQRRVRPDRHARWVIEALGG